MLGNNFKLVLPFYCMAWKIKRAGKPAWSMFVSGKWLRPVSFMDVYSPVTDSTYAYVPMASQSDAEYALKSAFKAKRSISKMPAHKRADLLLNVAERLSAYKTELLEHLAYEAGKPIKQGEGEFKASILRLKYAAQECEEIYGESITGDYSPFKEDKLGLIIRQPLGTILAITPFNYPIFTAISKIAPAIAAGNSVILKPASDTPIASMYIAKAFEEAGLPEGVLNVVTGKSSEIGDMLIRSNYVNGISFTGSTAVGHHIAETAGMKKLHLELGGKAPAIVLEDADLDLTAKEIVAGGLAFSGQRCDAISRVLVVDSVADELVKKIVNQAKKWKVGDPFSDKTSIGPLINPRAVSKVHELVTDAVDRGAELLMGGKKRKNHYWPTVLDKVPLTARIAWEETFGPVIPIIRVKDEKEAVKIANKSDYGLDAAVFTENIDKALNIAMDLEDGEVTINAHPAHGLGIFPFGGVKSSGMGREGIKYSILEMTEVKSIVIKRRL